MWFYTHFTSPSCLKNIKSNHFLVYHAEECFIRHFSLSHCISQLLLYNNHKVSEVYSHDSADSKGCLCYTHLMLATGEVATRAISDGRFTKEAFCKTPVHITSSNLSLPRGGMRMHHSDILLQGNELTEGVHCCCCVLTSTFMMGTHFPSVTPGQWLRSGINVAMQIHSWKIKGPLIGFGSRIAFESGQNFVWTALQSVSSPAFFLLLLLFLLGLHLDLKTCHLLSTISLIVPSESPGQCQNQGWIIILSPH